MRLLSRLASFALLAAGLRAPAAYGDAVATDDVAHSVDRQPVTIDVLKNDTSTTGKPLTLSAIAVPPKLGTAQISGDKILYTPTDPTFNGSDTFQYTVTDGDRADTGMVTIANTAIQANPDSAIVTGSAPVTIPVLKNDVDPDGNKLTLKEIGQPPTAGTATISGNTVVYTPGPNFRGTDSFVYTVVDTYSSAIATVTIFAPLQAAVGAAGLAIKDASGNIVGSLMLNVVSQGIFSGQIDLRGTRYALLGVFNGQGVFTGVAHGDHGMILPVQIRIGETSGTPTITATFATGDTASQAISTITATGRVATQGRYTVMFQPGGAATTLNNSISTNGTSIKSTTSTNSTTTTTTTTTTAATVRDSTPDGIGWMTMRINEQGYARVKGVAGDGNKFSTWGVLSGSDTAPTLVLFADAKVSAMAGTLAFSTSGVTGTFSFSGDAHGKNYPKGFSDTLTAVGALYNEPDGRLFSDDVTVATAGGRFTEVSATVRFDSDDNGTEVNGGREDLNIKVNARDGSFKGNFRNPDHSHQYAKFTGVIVQGGSTISGGGVFVGNKKAGQVTLSTSSGQSSSSTQ